MPKKIKTTKTLNPLHFEDLEPHRFEDLVRRLLYSFREWSDLDPIGRSGSDEGFDIRAWEKAEAITNVDEGEEGTRLSAGNLWQIQSKREKSITPAKMQAIITDGVDGDRPPHGYILAAATNISKRAYDSFRYELRKKGVKEFYFWGKDHLEDQLALPENDEVLFTFFGISLSPRQRSRTAEIKFNLNNKNKILRILFHKDQSIEEEIGRGKSLLLRDIKDRHYPDKTQYPDFEERRRWEEHEAVHVSANGVFFRARERYAYLNEKTKEWDYTGAVDLLPRTHNLDEQNERRDQDFGRKVEHYWRHLARRFQAKLEVYAFVEFEDMLIIDEKGDPEYAAPHIFIDFHEKEGPFTRTGANLTQNHRQAIIRSNELEAEYKKISVFPKTFPEPKKGKIHKLDKLVLPGTPLQRVQHLRGKGLLYSFDGKLDFLSEGDLIQIPKTKKWASDEHLEVTHVYETTVSGYTKERGSDHEIGEMEEYAGRKIKKRDRVTIYEIIQVYPGHRYLTYIDHDY